MKFSHKLLFIFATGALSSLVQASQPGPLPQAMDAAMNVIVQDNASLRTERDTWKRASEQFQQQLNQYKNAANPNCCDKLSNKCSNVGNRADICFTKRCAEPAGVMACQDPYEDPCCSGSCNGPCCWEWHGCCSSKTAIGGAGRLLAAFSILLPAEIVCCPVWSCCQSQSAAKCLCLEDQD
ncbi:MAG: hypothetical protein P4L31_06395 [Candidatus Babeliales bacterium]|nr:hypothetical protein [Candidatus Babeliales bacterium]